MSEAETCWSSVFSSGEEWCKAEIYRGNRKRAPTCSQTSVCAARVWVASPSFSGDQNTQNAATHRPSKTQHKATIDDHAIPRITATTTPNLTTTHSTYHAITSRTPPWSERQNRFYDQAFLVADKNQTAPKKGKPASMTGVLKVLTVKVIELD